MKKNNSDKCNCKWDDFIFDRVKSSPEWKYATINENGKAFFWIQKPVCYSKGVNTGFWFVQNNQDNKERTWRKISGNFDGASWKESLLIRTQKTKSSKTELNIATRPKWFKTGGYVWSSTLGFLFIDNVYTNCAILLGLDSNSSNMIISFEEIKNYSEAYVEPWTFEEAPIVLKVRNKRRGDCFVASLTHLGDCYYIKAGYPAISLKLFSERYEQLDHRPCGTLLIK